MSQPFVGEIRMFAGSFPPAGWAICNGAPMAISENDVLFQLIGTTYGGDGQTTFNLPDLRGRVPVHSGTGSSGTNYVLGETGGVEEVTLTAQQTPIHNHAFIVAQDGGNANDPTGEIVGASGTILMFRPGAGAATMDPSAVGIAGGNQPHTNIQPIAVINYIISLFGIYPHV